MCEKYVDKEMGRESSDTNCKGEHQHFEVTEITIKKVVVNFRIKNKNHEKIKLVSVKATKICLDCNEVIYENKDLTNTTSTFTPLKIRKELQISNIISIKKTEKQKFEDGYYGKLIKEETQISQLPLGTICNNEKHWIKQNGLWVCENCNHVINVHLINSKNVYECSECREALQSTEKDKCRGTYIHVDKSTLQILDINNKFNVANLLHISALIIENSNNIDTNKIRWMESISDILKGIDKEWKD